MEKAHIGRNGFTLIELMIALVLATIVLTLAVPSFRTMVQENRMVGQLNELTADMALARSEAVKAGTSVTVCRRDGNGDGTVDIVGNGDQCVTTAGTSVPWTSGWIAFTDVNRNSQLDTATDTILRIRDQIDTGSTLIFGRDRVRYDARGFAAGSNGTFIYCDSRGDANARGRILSNTGRLRAVDATGLPANPC